MKPPKKKGFVRLHDLEIDFQRANYVFQLVLTSFSTCIYGNCKSFVFCQSFEQKNWCRYKSKSGGPIKKNDDPRAGEERVCGVVVFFYGGRSHLEDAGARPPIAAKRKLGGLAPASERRASTGRSGA